MGNGKPVELETSWGDKLESESFTVQAVKLLDAGKLLDKRVEWGKFEGDIPYGYNTEGAYVTKVTLKPWFRLEMPEWGGYSKAPPACQTAWNAMWRKLRDHEEGHKEIFMDILAKAQKYVEKASDLTPKQLQTDMKKIVGSHGAAQKKFDTATGNGKKTGVILDIPLTCN